MSQMHKTIAATVLGSVLVVSAVLSVRQPVVVGSELPSVQSDAAVTEGETIEDWEFTARRGSRCRFVGANRFVGN